MVYDPAADQPVYAAVTASAVNDITAAHAMPITPGATYVFDLGYYDYGWWARLHAAGCRIVTRFKTNTPLTITERRAVPVGGPILSDRPPAPCLSAKPGTARTRFPRRCARFRSGSKPAKSCAF